MDRGRRLVFECLMRPPRVILAHAPESFWHDRDLPRPLLSIGQFGLVNRVECLSHGVAERITFGTRRGDNFRRCQCLPHIGWNGIARHGRFGAPCRSRPRRPDTSWPKPSSAGPWPRAPQMVRHLPDHDFTTEQIKNDHRIDPVSAGRNIGNILCRLWNYADVLFDILEVCGFSLRNVGIGFLLPTLAKDVSHPMPTGDCCGELAVQQIHGT